MGEAQRRQEIKQQIMVNINDLQTIMCGCGKFVFENVMIIKVMPAIYSNTGKPALLPVQCVRCIECKAVHSMEDILKNVSTVDEKKIISN